jgi:programmed cell death protein 5
MLKGILTVDARARLDRIRVVKPDKAGALENFILQRKARAIDEKQLIQLLDQMNQQIGETKVIRSRVQFSDSDDDNDDDLM